MVNEELIEKRKAAYRYIKYIVNRIPEPSIDEITELADALGGTFGLKDDLRALRDGGLDPTERLIEAFRDTVGATVSETEIYARLIEPFRSRQ